MPSEAPLRNIPITRINPEAAPENDHDEKGEERQERFSQTRIKVDIAHLATDARLSKTRLQETTDRRAILAKRIDDIRHESGSLYDIMRACEEQVLRARFSADPHDSESLKMVEEDVRRFARSPEAPPSLIEALSLPVIDDRRKAVIDALRTSLRDRHQSAEVRGRIERLWQRMDRAHRSVNLTEAALLHAKREFLPFQRRIDELQGMIDRLDAEHEVTAKQASFAQQHLEQRQKLEAMPAPRKAEIETLEEAFNLRIVRDENGAWKVLSPFQRDIVSDYVARFRQDPETTLDTLLAHLRTDYEREELRMALIKFSSLLDPSHASSEAPRHINRRRPAAHRS